RPSGRPAGAGKPASIYELAPRWRWPALSPAVAGSRSASPRPGWFLLPAGLAQAGHVAAHGGLAQHVAAEAELGVHRARPPGQGATRGLAGRRRVARQLLQLGRGVDLLFVARR